MMRPRFRIGSAAKSSIASTVEGYALQNKERAAETRLLWTPPAAQRELAPLSLLACALVIGLLLGLLAPPTNQEGVDGSLVLAGIVHYPPQSPMSRYFFGSWTIIHQLGALLLRAGLDQAYVSELLFLVPCALLVCAYAAVVYCFSGQFVFSLLAAALCFLTNPLAKFFASPDYMPVGLLWSQPPVQTFGFWAHAGAAWVVGCVAAGRKALAIFSALCLIAVHPVLGVYMTVLLTAALLTGRLLFATSMDGVAKGAVFGSAIVVVSFAFYLTTRPDLSAAIDQAAYDAYMNVWDTHRSHLMTPGIATRIAVAGAIAVAVLVAFIVFARPRRDAPLLTSGLVMLAVIVSTIAYFALHLTPDLLPAIFVRAAPGRLLNVQAFLSTPMALGLALYAIGQAVRERTTDAAAWIGRALPVAALVVVAAGLTQSVLSRRHLMIDGARMMAATRGLEETSARDTAAFWRDVRESGVTGLVLTSRATSRPTLDFGHLPIALNVGAFD
ncbi:MAG TPA: hypothetical protein VHU22_05010, partial [Xanthobacteraceae bacterium]|nr:hypothetical protein [Xanthobacteraceae bacterium]